MQDSVICASCDKWWSLRPTIAIRCSGVRPFGWPHGRVFAEGDQNEVEIDLPISRVIRLEISGDMAWPAAELIFKVREIGARGVAAKTAGYTPAKTRARSTEVYQRNDGPGNPEWRMWHFHCSPLPDADEPRSPSHRFAPRLSD